MSVLILQFFKNFIPTKISITTYYTIDLCLKNRVWIFNIKICKYGNKSNIFWLLSAIFGGEKKLGNLKNALSIASRIKFWSIDLFYKTNNPLFYSQNDFEKSDETVSRHTINYLFFYFYLNTIFFLRFKFRSLSKKCHIYIKLPLEIEMLHHTQCNHTIYTNNTYLIVSPIVRKF